ncbi:hypothetical protein [Haloarcula quadrata]|nr:hypothetical protein [Haloarcula quadrata]
MQTLPALGDVSVIDAVTVATLLVSGYIAYRSKANSLTTVREQERFLADRLQEGKFVEEPFVVAIDRVEVREKETRWYRLKRLVLRPFEGKALLTVRWEHHGMGEGWWESEYGDVLAEPFDFDVQHIHTEQVADTTLTQFELGTLDSDEIAQFAGALPRFAQIAVKGNENVQIEPVKTRFSLS